MMFFNLVFAFFLATKGFAGQESHGGGGHICKDLAGNVVSVELLDIWEAKVIDQLSFPSSNKPVDHYIAEALQKFKKYNELAASEVSKWLKYIRDPKNQILLPAEVYVEAPPDANTDFFQEGCELKGIAIFNDLRNKVILKPGHIAKMSNLDQAALWLHEAIYKFIRNTGYGTSSSVATRKIVGCLLSTSGCGEFQPLQIQGRRYYCSSASTDFIVARGDYNVTSISFPRINGLKVPANVNPGGASIYDKVEFLVGDSSKDPHFGVYSSIKIGEFGEIYLPLIPVQAKDALASNEAKHVVQFFINEDLQNSKKIYIKAYSKGNKQEAVREELICHK